MGVRRWIGIILLILIAGAIITGGIRRLIGWVSGPGSSETTSSPILIPVPPPESPDKKLLDHNRRVKATP